MGSISRKLTLIGIGGIVMLGLVACQLPPRKTQESSSVSIESGPQTTSEQNVGPDKMRPFLGVGYEPYTIQKKGDPAPKKVIRVMRVVPRTAAEKSGLLENDFILKFDKQVVDQIPQDDIRNTFSSYIADQKNVGETLYLEVLRNEIAIAGRIGSEPLPKEGLKPDDLPGIIAANNTEQSIIFNIQSELKLHRLEAILRQRPNRRTTPPPKNEDLFPEYETLSTPFAQLTQQMIETFELQGPYEDLLKRYEEDEWWDDGFRLKVFRYIHQDPLKLPSVTENVLHGLEEPLNQEGDALPQLVPQVASLLDAPLAPPLGLPIPPTSRSLKDHLAFIINVAEQAHQARNRALKRFIPEELDFLYERLTGVTDQFVKHFYLDANTPRPVLDQHERVLTLSHQVDFSQLLQANYLLNQLTNPTWLAQFQSVLKGRDWESMEHRGQVDKFNDILYTQETRVGQLIISGFGKSQHLLDNAIIIDLGGNDLYLNNAGAARSKDMPIAILIEFAGDDDYSATKAVSQGSGLLGSGILIDVSGNDLYTGSRLAQGTGVMGTGTLVDFSGTDQYLGQEYNQGFGLWGSGSLIDLAGHDHYRSHLFAQGVGAPKGVGILLDQQGNDSYYASGKHPSSYQVEGMFRGASQGLGIGFRNYASGGIGILLDSQGKDTFRAGNFSQGGGYFFGLGILKNGGTEDDVYHGSRYTQGFSAHSAAGILIDEGGNDQYFGRIGAMQSAAWDLGSAALIDKSGNDRYDAQGWGFGQGAAEHNGFSLFIDQQGQDTYLFGERSPSNNQYHGGASFAFFIDNGGEPDHYSRNRDVNNYISLIKAYSIFMDLDQSVETILEKNRYRHLIDSLPEESKEN